MDNDEHNKEGDWLTITDPLEIKIAETFNRKALAALANGDAKLREMRGCIINKDEEICRKLGQYYHQHWNDMNVKRGMFVVVEKISIQNQLESAIVKVLHSVHPGQAGMTDSKIVGLETLRTSS